MVFPQMKRILGMMMLSMIAASVAANNSANSTSEPTSGQNDALASSVGQSQPNQVAADCHPFCFEEIGRKRETKSAVWGAEQMQDREAQRGFQPQSRWLTDEEKASSLSTIMQLLARKREAYKRQQQMRARHIWKDAESMTSYKRGGSRQLLRARRQ